MSSLTVNIDGDEVMLLIAEAMMDEPREPGFTAAQCMAAIFEADPEAIDILTQAAGAVIAYISGCYAEALGALKPATGQVLH